MIPGVRGDTGDTVVKGAIGMDLEKRICDVCGYIYDPEEGDPTQGVAPGTPFDELPDEWVCPLCHLGKEVFSKL